jgi:hypothetical protein
MAGISFGSPAVYVLSGVSTCTILFKVNPSCTDGKNKIMKQEAIKMDINRKKYSGKTKHGEMTIEMTIL